MNDDIRSMITNRLRDSLRAIDTLHASTQTIATIVESVVACLRAGGTIYTCGNGGSAAEAMHLAEELIGRYRSNRRALRALCLNADPTALTCIANDFGYAEVFARQCDALLTKSDVLVMFSTSGKSDNLLRALEVAKDKHAISIALLGRDGGPCLALADHALVVASNDSGHVQEAHQVVLHIICEAVEQAFA